MVNRIKLWFFQWESQEFRAILLLLESGFKEDFGIVTKGSIPTGPRVKAWCLLCMSSGYLKLMGAVLVSMDHPRLGSLSRLFKKTCSWFLKTNSLSDSTRAEFVAIKE